MALLNSFGTQWGLLHDHMGRQFFVAASATYTIGGQSYAASDNNDGRSPERALLTIAAALALTTASAGDVVVLLPGAHSVAASLAMSKAGVMLTGLPGSNRRPLRSNTSITISASDEIINITAANIEICHLDIIPITAKNAIDFSSAASYLYIHDCYIDLNTPAVNIATQGIVALGAATGVIIDDCYFLADGAQGVAIDATGAINSMLRRCYFVVNAGTWAAAVLTGAATRLFVEACIFLCTGTAMTVGIDGTGMTGASGVIMMNNRFSSLVTKGVDNYDAGEAELSENYDAGVGATDGGVLVVAIT